ncbi:MAG: undecaprenyl-diphosphate phosphatase [Planctomycetales bacterium]
MDVAEYTRAVLLGAIQGVAEFLPISSSGHIVVFGKLFEQWFGGPVGDPVLFNVAVHLGTLGSILVVYRSDLRMLVRDYRLCAWIVLATIPAGVIGVLFKKKLEATFEQPLLVACGWLLTAVTLWYGQRFGKNQRTLPEMNARDATVVGLFQAVALIVRGFSRSGSTIAGGLLLGFQREAAAKFSFLVAIPAIAGAGVLEIGPVLREALTGTVREGATSVLTAEAAGILVTGGLVAFVVGWVALRWLIKLIVRRGVGVFALYCLILSLITFAWQGYEMLRAP